MSLHIGDAREWARQLPPQSIQTIVTSPPYFGLRAYLAADHPDKAREMGSEQTPEAFVAALVDLFAALWPALKDDGTIWLNLGDSYARNGGTQGGGTRELLHMDGTQQRMTRVPEGSGLKEKDLIGIPWRTALALQAAGWYLRSDIVWHKPQPMPESVTDRPTRAHEYLFLLTKSARYFYDAAAIAEPCVAGDRGSTYVAGKTGNVHASRGQGERTDKQAASGLRTYAGFNARWDEAPTTTRNKRDVWTVATAAFPDAHYATFPPELIRPCILAGSRPGDTVADPFTGSGTTWQVAAEERRAFVGCDLDERSRAWSAARLARVQTRMGWEQTA